MSDYKISFAENENKPAPAGFSIGRLFLGLLMAIAAVALSAGGWGLLAYWTNSIYVMAAIVVGFVVSFAVTYPFPRIGILLGIVLFIPTAILTVAAVLLGDYLYYVLNFMAEGATLNEAIATVATYFVELAAEDSLASVIFAVIGTVVGFFNAISRD